MKKVMLAVLIIAFALFLTLPNLSWAQEDMYKAKCAACHGADGKGSAAGKKMGAPAFSSATVQSASDATLADFIENGFPCIRQQGCQRGAGRQTRCLRKDIEVVVRIGLIRSRPAI
jgi:competence protein ComGC